MSFVQDLSARNHYTVEEQEVHTLGTIQFPFEVSPAQVEKSLALYYKGVQVQLDDMQQQASSLVSYSFKQLKSSQKFYVLIAGEVCCATALNTVKFLYVPEGVSYVCYQLDAARGYDKAGTFTGYFWKSQAISLPQGNKIPDDTCIFLFDATLVKGLEVKSWTQSNSWFMPTIVIKSADKETIMQAIAASGLAAVDLNSFHMHKKETEKQQTKQIVTTLVR